MGIEKAPIMFIGHGSPMNAIADNDYTRTLAKLRSRFPNPTAILCVSAHWMTQGTKVTSMAQPKTIHDFGGFPDELFAVQYPAPGSPEIAQLITDTIKDPHIILDDHEWGLDHGTWSVLRHIFPEAKIPVLQLSLDIKKPAPYHYELGQKLRFLRDRGVWIVGSGNIVHNLRQISWDAHARPYQWAIAFDQWVKEKLALRSFEALIHDFLNSEEGRLSVPTNEHYYPLLYILGASDENDSLYTEYEELQNASISMRSISFSS